MGGHSWVKNYVLGGQGGHSLAPKETHNFSFGLLS